MKRNWILLERSVIGSSCRSTTSSFFPKGCKPLFDAFLKPGLNPNNTYLFQIDVPFYSLNQVHAKLGLPLFETSKCPNPITCGK